MSDIQVIPPEQPRVDVKLFPKQETFAAIPVTIKEAFFGGAAGPGKSFMLLMDPLLRKYHMHPRFHGILFRESFPQLEESLIHESQTWYKLFGGTYNGTEHHWTFPSGAKIRFSYLAKDEQSYDHDTAQYNYVAFDELTAFTRFRWMYLVHSRCRTTVEGLPAYARAASNPLGIGHGWVKERFIDPAPEGGRIIAERMPDGSLVKRIFIKARVTDNPLIMERDPNYINSLMLLPEAEKRSKLYGDWDAIAGAVFREFRTLHNMDEPENAVHVVDPFTIPDYWPVFIAIDWGFSALCWAGFFAVSPDGRVYLFREMSWRQVKISVWGADLARAAIEYPGLRTPLTLDKSAWGQRGEEKTLAEQVAEATGFEVEKSDSDRVGGKMLIHDYLRWTKRPPRYIPPEGYRQDIEEKLYRIKGADAAADYKRLFDPEPEETNLPRYQIFRSCPLAINALVQASSDPKNPEDTIEYDGDDPYDGQRYGLKRAHRYFEEAHQAGSSVGRREAIVEKLHKSGDMNAFYREMDKLEEDELVAEGPVRRYNRIRSGRSYRTRRYS